MKTNNIKYLILTIIIALIAFVFLYQKYSPSVASQDNSVIKSDYVPDKNVVKDKYPENNLISNKDSINNISKRIFSVDKSKDKGYVKEITNIPLSENLQAKSLKYGPGLK